MNKYSDTLGYIHSYETFGTLDGPGIRFVVFLQGCKLACKYCHNRDTWTQNTGKRLSVSEVSNKILKYLSYFKASNGGVTLSGGEPLLQQEFTLALLKELKYHNIHTAIDTSGMFEITDNIKEILKYTDLVLLDIKHIDSQKCKELCGYPNTLELEFAKYLNSINKPVWIRQVLVPTLTDDENDLLKLKEFLSTLTNIQKIELLPYTDLGKSKWENLNIKYPLSHIPNATNDDIIRAKQILGLD